MKFNFIRKILKTGLKRSLLMIFFVSVTAAFINGCAQYDSGVGGVISDRELRGVLRDVTIPIDEIGTDIRGDIYKPSPSLILPLGKDKDFTSDVIFYFSNFNTLGDTILEIDSVWFNFYHYSLLDSDAVQQAPFTAGIYHLDHHIDLGEDEDINIADYRYDDTDHLELLDEIEIEWEVKQDTVEVTSDSIEIAAESYQAWIDSAMADTSGILLRFRTPDNAAFMRQFTSNTFGTSDARPHFSIKGTFVSGEDTLTDSVFTHYANFSSFLVKDDNIRPDGYVSLTNGYSRRLLFFSDFEWLNELGLDPSDGSHNDHSINLVELVLHTDHENTSNYEAMSQVSASVISSNWIDTTDGSWYQEPDTVTYGLASPYAYHAIYDTLAKVRVNITAVVRNWVAEPDSNFGIAVRGTNELKTLNRRLFYDNSAAEELRPSFRVIYTEFVEDE